MILAYIHCMFNAQHSTLAGIQQTAYEQHPIE